MRSHKEFVEEALRSYEELPLETNEIYKKYTVHVPLDPEPAQADINLAEKEMEELSKEISAKTRIKFDAVISEHAVKSFNARLRIMGKDDVDMVLLEGKMFKSGDDKLAAFANASSVRFVSIEGREGETMKLNLLFIGHRRLPVQVMINAPKGARIEVFEMFASGRDGGGLVSALHEVNAAEGAEVELDALHNEGEGFGVINLCKAVAGNNSRINANFVYSGGQVTKTRSQMDSAGSNSVVDVCEFALGSKDQKFDLGAHMANTKPKSQAYLESGAVLTGTSRCMLKGFAKVENGTKGCVSRITQRGILLSKDAHIDALPDMAIDYSNEVKATHSAATAPIDREALFYLESRGLDEKAARKTFITAFMAKYISKMSNGIAGEVAMSVMLDKLESGSIGNLPEVSTSGVWTTW